MQDEATLRRKRMLELMAGSANPVTTTATDPSTSTPNLDPNRTVRPTINLPQAGDTNASALAGLQRPNELSTQVQPRIRVGYLTAGLSGLDKVLERKKALESADPEQSVRVTPDFVEQLPPRMQGVNAHSRWRQLGETALASLAGNPSDPNNNDPNAILGRLLGGSTTAAVNPRGGAQIVRRHELDEADNDIARGIQLEGQQAQLGSLKALQRQRELDPALDAAKIDADRDYRNAQLEIEREKAAGLLTQQQYQRKKDELDRASREKTAAGNNAATVEAARIRSSAQGQETPAALGERGRKAAAAQAEFDQLSKDEATAGEQKNAAYAALEDIKKTAPNDARGDMLIREAEQAAESANRLYQSYADKKADAQRRANENTGPTTSGTGPRWSLARWKSDPANKNKDENAAKAAAQAKGYTVIP